MNEADRKFKECTSPRHEGVRLLPVSEFYWKASRHAFDYHCKVCRRARQSEVRDSEEYRARNRVSAAKPERKATKAAYYSARNAELKGCPLRAAGIALSRAKRDLARLRSGELELELLARITRARKTMEAIEQRDGRRRLPNGRIAELPRKPKDVPSLAADRFKLTAEDLRS